MKIVVIRHAETDGTRFDRAGYGPLGPPLNAAGVLTAQSLEAELQQLGVDLKSEAVAISELVRTQQTALGAGFLEANLRVEPLLNEVITPDIAAAQVLIDNGVLPDEAAVAARRLLANRPPEAVWVTHGLVIAGLRQLLGLAGFVPAQGSITIIEV